MEASRLNEDCTPWVAGRSPILAGMLRGQQRLGPLVDVDLFVLPSCHEDLGVVPPVPRRSGRSGA